MTESEQLEIITKLSKITTLPQRGLLLKYRTDFVNVFGESVKSKAICFDLIDTYSLNPSYDNHTRKWGCNGITNKDLKTAVILAVLNKFNKG